ncbi:MAG: hypothetical protein DLM64_15905 [Solirubrobacterales bacterium]|nr:MAG: hypothetical protein DLM64_15905 [Solirubrobacterales bacterium]
MRTAGRERGRDAGHERERDAGDAIRLRTGFTAMELLARYLEQLLTFASRSRWGKRQIARIEAFAA